MPPSNVFPSSTDLARQLLFPRGCTKEGGDGSQAAHTSCVEGEEDFVFGHSSPFNGLMDKITDAW